MEWNSISSNTLFYALEEFRNKANVKCIEDYKVLYEKSIDSPELFWQEVARQFFWKSKPTGSFLTYNFDITKGPIKIEWMKGAKTNVCFNLLDKNIEKMNLVNTVAYHWVGNDPQDCFSVTYSQLLKEVCKFGNVLKQKGVTKGDRVAIYMPMVTELVVAILACSRIGAIHSVIFAGFSSQSLAERIVDAQCSIVVTTDGAWRGTKLLNLKEIVDEALRYCNEKGHTVKTNIVSKHVGPKQGHGQNGRVTVPGTRPVYDLKTPWNPHVDCWWDDVMTEVSDVCDPEWVDSEDPLFLLYTSGSTGKPKGVVHTTGGYMLYAAETFKYVFDCHPGDVYFCTADIGWITGHTYGIYGPLSQAVTSILFEGTPFYPHPGRYWEIVEKYCVNKFYTAPTAIRALMKHDDIFVKQFDCSSLKVLGSVGEPINPEAWLWYHTVVGEGRCPIVDTFWQTETTFPFFGVLPAILDEKGQEIKGPGEGYLVFKKPWPGIMRAIYNNQEQYETTYFKKFPGYYCTGDGAKRDDDGYYWVTGRVDDMLNVSGHLLSTAEVESALIEHEAVAESAVVSHPHPVKGECLYCYIVLKEGYNFNKNLIQDLKDSVRHKIGPFATPEFFHLAQNLPKTRSGKIIRRLLRKVARNDSDLGDLSTLAEDNVIEYLFNTRPQLT
ncbi:acetyl-coenzyme A synthetase, cytoplasmic-like isoform X2 [Tachypleus tridentatus]|uniref:acetyl-coenzyme A synthetase, cytoplasmic-like isoform X2 n=1 Tax=Tachypleus tridentatus TaxID=6853 RepID=UPI003FD679C7